MFLQQRLLYCTHYRIITWYLWLWILGRESMTIFQENISW